MLLFLGLILVFLFGHFFVLAIARDISFEEKLALSFGFGLGFLTLLMFYLSIFKISLNPINLLLILAVLNIVLLKIVYKKIKNLKISFDFKKAFFILIFLALLILILFIFNKIKVNFHPEIMIIPAVFYAGLIILSIFFRKKEVAKSLIISLLLFCFLGILAMDIYWPIHEWDSLALYDFLGRLFYEQKIIDFPLNLPKLSYYVGYPFLTPITHTFIYLLGGENPKFIYSLFYGFLLLFFYSFIKKETSIVIALFFTLILATTYPVIENGASSYTNLPFAFYQTIGAFFLYRFLKTKKNEFLIISSLGLGFSGWTRPASEPFFLACFLTLLFFSFSWKKWLNFILFLLIYLLISYPWQIYIKNTFGVKLFDISLVIEITSYTLRRTPLNLFDFSYLKEIIQRLFTILLDFRLYGPGGILLLIFLFLDKKTFLRERILSFLIFANLFLWVIFIFGFGFTASFSLFWRDILYDSMTRVFLGIYPLLLFYVAKTDLVWQIFEGKKNVPEAFKAR